MVDTVNRTLRRILRRPLHTVSRDPNTGLQPITPESQEWKYPNRPTGMIRPTYQDTRSRDLAAERPRTGRPTCSDCGTPLDPKWCDPAARAAVGDA